MPGFESTESVHPGLYIKIFRPHLLSIGQLAELKDGSGTQSHERENVAGATQGFTFINKLRLTVGS